MVYFVSFEQWKVIAEQELWTEEIRGRGASYFERIAYHGVGNKQTQATLESSQTDKIS